jgi:hypothetical protein
MGGSGVFGMLCPGLGVPSRYDRARAREITGSVRLSLVIFRRPTQVECALGSQRSELEEFERLVIRENARQASRGVLRAWL